MTRILVLAPDSDRVVFKTTPAKAAKMARAGSAVFLRRHAMRLCRPDGLQPEEPVPDKYEKFVSRLGLGYRRSLV